MVARAQGSGGDWARGEEGECGNKKGAQRIFEVVALFHILTMVVVTCIYTCDGIAYNYV